jgi:hypothetical protein
MLEKVWDKLDKFYIVLAVVLMLMAIMIVVTFRGIFSAYLSAYEISDKDTGVNARIKKEALDEAYVWLTTKKATPLLIRGLSSPKRN